MIHNNKQRGFSIVELMVAMLISVLLLGGVLSVMYTSRITYDENTRIARLQEYARSSIELMLRDLRSSGQHGCARPLDAGTFRNLLVTPTAVRYNFAVAVQGYEGTVGPFAPAMPTGAATGIPNALAGNDVIAIRTVRSDIPPMRLAAPFAGGTGTLDVDRTNAPALPAGTPLLISDCEFANVITNSAAVASGASVLLARATGPIAVPGSIQQPGNTTVPLPPYAAGTLIAAVETVTYYIRLNAAGEPALWRIVGNNPPQELVEGVERLELQYGEDTNGDQLVDAYRNANAVGNWDNVLSVSIAMLLRSPDQSVDPSAGQTYDMLGTVVGPFADQRPRLLFTTTANVRNRTG